MARIFPRPFGARKILRTRKISARIICKPSIKVYVITLKQKNTRKQKEKYSTNG